MPRFLNFPIPAPLSGGEVWAMHADSEEATRLVELTIDYAKTPWFWWVVDFFSEVQESVVWETKWADWGLVGWLVRHHDELLEGV